ncbi:MAG: hypothetical protein ACREN2_08210 [Candidatus Dormibacteria bacterium]
MTGVPVTLVTAAITFWLASVASHEPRGQTAPNPVSSPCALETSAFLPASALSGFTQIVDLHLSGAPIKGGAPGATPMLAVSDFASGRMIGYLSNEAIDGPDRAQEDALSRSLGHPPGRFPEVPLSGAIVRDSPGLLEAYEFALVYHSERGAQDFVRWFSGSLGAAGGTVASAAGAPNISAYFFPAQTTGSTPPYEQTYDYIERIGRVVIRVAFSGGQQLEPAQLSNLATRAQNTMLTRCPQ